MTNREKLNIIYERMWWYTNPRKDDKTWWTIYDQNPVLIGDVLDYIDSLETWLDGKDKAQWRQNAFWLLMIWENKKRDLTEQSDECIDFVYALTKE